MWIHLNRPHESSDPTHDDCVQNNEEFNDNASTLSQLRDDDAESSAEHDYTCTII